MTVEEQKQRRVNALARKLVDEVLYGPFHDMTPAVVDSGAEELESALNEYDAVIREVSPCW